MSAQRPVLTLSIAHTHAVEREFVCSFVRLINPHTQHSWQVLTDLTGDVVLYHKDEPVQPDNPNAILLPVGDEEHDILNMLVLPPEVEQVPRYVDYAIHHLNGCGYRALALLSHPLGVEACAAMARTAHVLQQFAQSMGHVFNLSAHHELVAQQEQVRMKGTILCTQYLLEDLYAIHNLPEYERE